MAHKTHRPTCKIMTLAQHVTEVLRNCSYHTRALRHIRPLLTFDVAKTIAHSIVSSRLDYANALLHGTSASNRDRLQNSLAGLCIAVLRPLDRTVDFAVQSAASDSLIASVLLLPGLLVPDGLGPPCPRLHVRLLVRYR